MTLEEMAKKKDHNSLMIEIQFSLNEFEFDDVKNCSNSKQMWDKLTLVHGVDPNVLRDGAGVPKPLWKYKEN